MKKIYLSGLIASLLFGCATNDSDVAPTNTVAEKPMIVKPLVKPAKATPIPLNANTLALVAKLDVNKSPNENFDSIKLENQFAYGG
ncbi:hypothetical protein ACLKMH_23575 [Psychromonas sp. KJ10-10]|uniref:hypothetical protein n=1 Tax=Psychromonas sp. KJ10-10 TaxID=3391823 RepID=UPI0039B47D9C